MPNRKTYSILNILKFGSNKNLKLTALSLDMEWDITRLADLIFICLLIKHGSRQDVATWYSKPGSRKTPHDE